jgi:hypothetical protein
MGRDADIPDRKIVTGRHGNGPPSAAGPDPRYGCWVQREPRRGVTALRGGVQVR